MSGKIISLQPTPHKSWWQNPDIWKDRYTYSEVVFRPTEDAALQNVYSAALVVSGHYRITLTELERDVDITFTGFKRARSGYPDMHYVTQTAMKLSMPLFQVRSILSDIEAIKRNYERAEVFNLIALPNVIDRFMVQTFAERKIPELEKVA